jgi:hypothetical protein
MDPEQYAAMLKYLHEVRGVVRSCQSVLTEKEAREIEHLIDHDEPAEGLRALAWIITEKKARIPATTIEAIRNLTEGLVDRAHLPANLDECAVGQLEK